MVLISFSSTDIFALVAALLGSDFFFICLCRQVLFVADSKNLSSNHMARPGPGLPIFVTSYIQGQQKTELGNHFVIIFFDLTVAGIRQFRVTMNLSSGCWFWCSVGCDWTG